MICENVLLLYLHYSAVVLSVGGAGTLQTSPDKKDCVCGCKYTLKDEQNTAALDHIHTYTLRQR